MKPGDLVWYPTSCGNYMCLCQVYRDNEDSACISLINIVENKLHVLLFRSNVVDI